MIGGEFEIDLRQQGRPIPVPPDTYLYSSGRAALYQILKSLKPRHSKIWFPDYLCQVMVEAAEKAGFECHYYELDEKFEITVDSLEKAGFKDGDLALEINYFGLQKLNGPSMVVKETYPNSLLIEDDVQAYFVFAEQPNPFADYRFSSYRKTFAVPDGAPVWTKREMPQVSDSNTFVGYKIKAGNLKFHRKGLTSDDEYLSLFKKGGDLIDENLDSVMSEDSQRLFANVNMKEVKAQRQRNASALLNSLSSLGIKTILPVADAAVPLFIPIYLDNRDEVRKRMFANQIFCPVHWPMGDIKLKKGQEMAEHELSLIVDQRYWVEDMDLIINNLR